MELLRLVHDAEEIVRKIKRAVTDCEGVITGDPERAGVYNLLSIYSACTETPMDDAVAAFAGKGYGDLKSAVADAVVAVLQPIQTSYKRLLTDRKYLTEQIDLGTEKARRTAGKTVRKVYHKMGFDS